MKQNVFLKSFFFSTLLVGAVLSCTTPHRLQYTAPEQDLSDYIKTSCESVTGTPANLQGQFIAYVDPFMGTSGHGHVFPGATTPFGMVQVSPDNAVDGWDWCSGYHYTETHIDVFSHKHLSGTGAADLGDIGLMPSITGLQKNSSFSHQNEYAHPGYYAVKLDNGILVELTATPRVALHRYTFPTDSKQFLRIDLQHQIRGGRNLKLELKQVDDYTVQGLKLSSNWAKYQSVWFVLKSDRPIVKAKWVNGMGLLEFDSSNAQLNLKVALSSVSAENANLNLQAEAQNLDFDGAKLKAEGAWNQELGKIIATGSEEDLKVFYGALYHATVTPTLYSDVNGEFMEPNGKVTQAKGYDRYSTFSLWDTYRAAHPLYTLLYPELSNDFVNSMLAHYDVRGVLPIWELEANENYCMIGNHSVAVIADAFLKGIRGYDTEKAYQACKDTLLKQDHRGLNYFRELGYIPEDVWEDVSRTLEDCYDFWCVALWAKEIGNEADYQYFYQQSQNYRNLFDPETKLMRPKYKNGKFIENFNPYAHQQGSKRHYTEGNAWQYTWSVQHDVPGLIELMGGNDSFLQQFNQLFEQPSDANTGTVKFVDVTGLIGQYAHGNEPSHHVVYMYAWTDEAWRGQKLIYQIFNDFYHSRPNGLIGNEDCGQMSAWYVFSAMGFYPVDPACGQYMLGAPRLSSAQIPLANGKTFKMTAENIAPDHPYVQSVTLNGKPLTEKFITYDQIMAGSHLHFVMGETAQTN